MSLKRHCDLCDRLLGEGEAPATGLEKDTVRSLELQNGEYTIEVAVYTTRLLDSEGAEEDLCLVCTRGLVIEAMTPPSQREHKSDKEDTVVEEPSNNEEFVEEIREKVKEEVEERTSSTPEKKDNSEALAKFERSRLAAEERRELARRRRG